MEWYHNNEAVSSCSGAGGITTTTSINPQQQLQKQPHRFNNALPELATMIDPSIASYLSQVDDPNSMQSPQKMNYDLDMINLLFHNFHPQLTTDIYEVIPDTINSAPVEAKMEGNLETINTVPTEVIADTINATSTEAIVEGKLRTESHVDKQVVIQQEVKNKRLHCQKDGCVRIVKSKGLCQRHSAKPKSCRTPSIKNCAINTVPNEAIVEGKLSTESHVDKQIMIRQEVKHKRRYCQKDGCVRIVKSQGLCQGHGAKPKFCRIKDCTKQSQGNFDGMCKAHYKVTNRNGNPSEDNPIFETGPIDDSNRYVHYGPTNYYNIHHYDHPPPQPPQPQYCYLISNDSNLPVPPYMQHGFFAPPPTPYILLATPTTNNTIPSFSTPID